MKVLDLFSGIGGFSLGLERAGMKTVAFCEIEPFQRSVLRKLWPDVPIYEDIRGLTADRLRADGIVPDAICGGFPCQDISDAGKRAGIAGKRSGLWSEYARIIGELRPRFVFVENVAALLGRGLDRVLGDLSALGYDAEWEIIQAADLGAWHERERIWLVAYPCGAGLEGLWSPERIQAEISIARRTRFASDTPREPWLSSIRERGLCAVIDGISDRPVWAGQQWPKTESLLCRVADGVPNRSQRVEALGNAVVPQIPEMMGHAVMRAAA